MPHERKPAKRAKAKRTPTTTNTPTHPTARRVWMGTGLCPEAQGDGVPCHGVDGECERCGRALARPTAGADVAGGRPPAGRPSAG